MRALYFFTRNNHAIGLAGIYKTMSNFLLEYEEGIDALGVAGSIYYKYLSLFSVKLREGEDCIVRFGSLYTNTSLRNAEDLKSYLKEQKEWVRETRGKFPNEMRMRLWWVVQKCLDLGLFTPSEQKFLILWLDGCNEQIRDVMFTNPSEYPPACTPPRGVFPACR